MALNLFHKKHVNIPDPTQADLDARIAAGQFPPGTTLADISLGSDWNDTHDTSAIEAALATYIPLTQKAASNGVATLDGGGKVPASQLPSYVDDVLEYPNLASFPNPGETGKIYIADDTNKQYRWSGTTYIEISNADVGSGQAGQVAYYPNNGTAVAGNSGIYLVDSGTGRWTVGIGTSTPFGYFNVVGDDNLPNNTFRLGTVTGASYGPSMNLDARDAGGHSYRIVSNGSSNPNVGGLSIYDTNRGASVFSFDSSGVFSVGQLGSGLVKTSSGVFSNATAGTDYQAPITLTTSGTSGAATFTGGTLNIPQYQAQGNYATGGGMATGTNTGDQVVPANTTSTTSQWFNAYNAITGAFTKSQPAFTDISGTLAIAKGGTGQTTQQAAINALAGAVTAGTFLRGDGTNDTMSAIQAADVPTLNQNTTGSAAKWTTARNLAGNSVDGSANIPFANKFIVQGTTDTGLSGAQFMGNLATGLVKNTTTSGVQSIAVAGTDYQIPVSLTTTGTGAATFNTSTGALNIPTPATAGSVTNNFNNIRIDQSPNPSGSPYGLLSGTIDGSNTTFTVSNGKYLSGTLMVFLNGPAQKGGTAADIVELAPNSGTFQFVTAPPVGTTMIQASYVATNTSTGTSAQTYATKTANYTVTSTDYYLRSNGSSTITFTLPSAVTADGYSYRFKNVGTGTLILSPVLSQTIDGSSTRALLANDTNIIFAANGNWDIL